MLQLSRMSEKEFDFIKGKLISEYAKKRVENKSWSVNDATDLAKEAISHIFKDGAQTKGEYLLDIFQKDEHLGYIWFSAKAKKVYINDLYIFKKYRRLGFEKEVLKLVEKKVIELGGTNLIAHIYGSHKKFEKIYNDLEFKVTDLYLDKKL